MLNWLESRQVIFKTIAYICVSALTIYLGIQANCISNKQNQILENEANISKFQQLPSVFVSISNNESDGHEVLSLFNDGGALHHCQIYPAAFLYCANSQLPITHISERIKLLLPIEDYYESVAYTGDRINKIAQIKGQYDSVKINEIINEAERKFVSVKNGETVKILRYVRVQYLDKFNDSHIEVHSVEPTYGSYLLKEPPIMYDSALELIKIHEQENYGISWLTSSSNDIVKNAEIFKSFVLDKNPMLYFIEYQPPAQSNN